MVKILHTADVHLKAGSTERWQALEKIIQLGQAEKIDLLIISGDLFDSKEDAGKLYSSIRERFSKTGFKVLLLPGNHDAEVYKEGFYFGEDVHIFKTFQTPYQVSENDAVINIWGLPYEPLGEIEVLDRLTKISDQALRDAQANQNILVFHGELLETYYSGEDFGDEGTVNYMPVKQSNIAQLCFDYILGGHFHTHFSVFDLTADTTGKKFFIYPGSPVSVTRKETGERKVNLFETGNPPAEKLVPTFHYQTHEIHLDPLAYESSPGEQIKQSIGGLEVNENARLILNVSGYFSSQASGMKETDLVDFMEQVCQEKIAHQKKLYGYEIVSDFRDLGVILDDELFKRFEDALAQYNLDTSYRQKIREMVIEAMMEVKN